MTQQELSDVNDTTMETDWEHRKETVAEESWLMWEESGRNEPMENIHMRLWDSQFSS